VHFAKAAPGKVQNAMFNWGLALTALALGLAYAAAPGAVNTEALRRGVTHGARSAFLVEAGSLIGDSLWAVLGVTGVALFAHALAIQITLGIAGGCFLLRMGWLALHEAFVRRDINITTTATTRGNFSTGAVFGLANPVGLAFWSGLGSSVAATGTRGFAFVLFFCGFFVGAVLWCFSIALVIHLGRRWIGPQAFRWVNIFCGGILSYFGLRILWLMFQSWAEHHLSSFIQSERLLLRRLPRQNI
jgi:threonine/homoserine/homoserine lactone efflux protein